MGFEDHEIEDDSLGTGLKFMLAAAFSLFAIVLLVIIFHFYARHLRKRQLTRRHRDQQLVNQINIITQITPLDGSIGEPPPNQGLDPLIIASLPKLLYKQTDQFSQQGEAIECSVCLGTMAEDATIRVLPNCKHLFHADCVDMWFGSNITCPICRTVAEPRVQPTAPPVENGVPVQEANNELAEGGGSGLRMTSFQSMVSRERSLRRDHNSEGFATTEDIERL